MARVPIDSHDSLSIQCQSIRDQADGLLAEYKKDGTSSARLKEIIGELQTLGSDWNAIGCRAMYGDVTIIVVPELRGLGKIVNAAGPMDSVLVEDAKRDRIDDTFYWVQGHAKAMAVGIKAVSMPGKEIPDVLAADPAKLAKAARAVARSAEEQGAPEFVVAELTRIAARYAIGVQRLPELAYAMKALASLNGLRKPSELQGPLFDALEHAPDRANAEKVGQILVAIRRPPRFGRFPGRFPGDVGLADGGCDWGCCLFACVMCELACPLCCAAACLLC